ncbi:hypothetical protein [Butyrivibrio sp.]|uniref:hypothetical protein n=1 Tax=Butyrivibrio sp. TaxID=28121 RepID=UPI0025C589DB|nr:hypothetical protein [Butyrivibrio sp.]MBE5839435.1 hypothetical protein [Butyrivibrio sp.]
MSFAGLNDRDNTNNDTRTQENSSLYGMNYSKRETTRKAAQKSGSGPVISFLYHANSFPSDYYHEFKLKLNKLVEYCKSEICTYTQYHDNYEIFENEYVKELYHITELAYGLPEFHRNMFEVDLIYRACLEKTEKAMAVIEDLFCSRGEAFSKLPSKELELLIDYYHKKDEFDSRDTEITTKLAYVKSELKTWKIRNNYTSIDSAGSKCIKEHVEQLKTEINDLTEELNGVKEAQKVYSIKMQGKVSLIWSKIRFYNPG